MQQYETRNICFISPIHLASPIFPAILENRGHNTRIRIPSTEGLHIPYAYA